MVIFEEKIRESNTLFREHQRIMDIPRRLSQQNEYVQLTPLALHKVTHHDSQLLELLHDLNQSAQVPPSHRYDLRLPSTALNPSYTDGTNTLPCEKSYASFLSLPYASPDTMKIPNNAIKTAQ